MIRRGHEVYLFASGDSVTSAKLVATTPKALGQSVSFDREKACNRLAYELALKLKPDVIWDNTLAIHAHKLHKNRSEFLFKVDLTLQPEQLINSGNIPVVHTLHGPAKEHLPKLVHDLSARGHYFVSISCDQARRYTRHIVKNQLLGTVYNAVDINLFTIDKSKKADDYLFWIGRYGMEKGAHIVLEVAHQLKMPLKLLGKKDEPHEKAYYRRFIEPNLLSDDTVYESSLPVPDKIVLYQGAKATIMGNLWPEPFGLIIAESMACGTAVVGPALGSLPELIDSTGLLITVNDLRLNENDTTVTKSQLKYIDRIVDCMKKMNRIPPEVPRKRAEHLFSAAHNVDGYEEAFFKAIYLNKK
jgi:glycosyltransferase involved in cell wall biosynthesis